MYRLRRNKMYGRAVRPGPVSGRAGLSPLNVHLNVRVDVQEDVRPGSVSDNNHCTASH